MATNCLACTKSGRDCPENCLMAKYIDSVQVLETIEGHFGSLANFIRLVEAGALNRERSVQTLLLEASYRKRDPVSGLLGAARRLSDEAIDQLQEKYDYLITLYLASTLPATSSLAKKPRLDQESSSNTVGD